jgi:molybdate transport system substrate-binding protein
VVTVTTSTGVGADSIASRVQRGEPVDVIILPAAALEDLIRGEWVVADTRVDIARSSIGMAVRSGAPKPDISSVEALTRTLLGARSIAYSASVSGEYLSKELFPKLGLSEKLAGKSVRVERERVGAVVARGEAEIGFQQISELLEVKGVDLVGPLPPDVQRITLVAAGVAAKSADPSAARAFIRFLASPDAADTLRKTGLEPLTRP